ncbi:Hypothetical predicted protein, partial [Olea europaea subsp. europaea]
LIVASKEIGKYLRITCDNMAAMRILGKMGRILVVEVENRAIREGDCGGGEWRIGEMG